MASKTFFIDGVDHTNFQNQKITISNVSAVIKRKRLFKPVLEINTVEVTDDEGFFNFASRIVTCYRLEKEENIGFFETKEKEKSGLLCRQPKDLGITIPAFSFKDINPEQIKTRIQDLSKIFTKNANGEEQNGMFRLALGWFNSSYNEDRMENILIDLMVCLETLFVRGKEEKYKNQWVTTRVGQFLEREGYLGSHSKSVVDEDNHLLYQIRNCVVHEGKWFKKVVQKNHLGYPGALLIKRLRDYVRRSLLGYIKLLKEKNFPPIEQEKEIICSLFNSPYNISQFGTQIDY